MSLRLDTYSKILISDNQPLADIIRELSQPVKPEEQIAIPDGIELLTDQDLMIAMNSPFHPFLKQTLAALSTLASSNFYKIATDSDSIITKAVQRDYKSKIDELTQFKQANNTAVNELDDLIDSHYQQWLEYDEAYQNALIKQAAQQKIQWSPTETASLTDGEPLPKLLARLTDLNINTGTKRGLNTRSFQHYYTLKLRELLTSALAREQVSTAELPKVLLQKLNAFNELMQQQQQSEDALLSKQKEALNAWHQEHFNKN